VQNVQGRVMLHIYFVFCVQMYCTLLRLYALCGSLKAIVLQVHVGLSQVPLMVKGHVDVAPSPNILLLTVLHDLYMDTLTLIHSSIPLFSESHLSHLQ